MKNALLPIVTKHPSSPGIAHIHQDLTIYLSDLEAGHELTFTQPEGRNIFVFVIEGVSDVKRRGPSRAARCGPHHGNAGSSPRNEQRIAVDAHRLAKRGVKAFRFCAAHWFGFHSRSCQEDESRRGIVRRQGRGVASFFPLCMS
ncbi:hypothetical protein DI43_17105 [Geobacillus sp. CAMR12739]|nr:hypothetical protein DI43_17105 [Geobacillus sp. CAMR12739]